MDNKAETISRIASRLGAPAQWLDALINFETAGTYSTTIQNPNSSAVGLIQLTDARARDLGFRTSKEAVARYPDFESQMEHIVYPALKPYAPFRDKQSLFMAVFYPRYRDVPPSTEFPDSVKRVNPGIETVQDYIDFVNRRIVQANLVIPLKMLPVLILAAVGIGVWMYSRKRPER